MVEGELAGGERLAAVLAAVGVARVDVAAVELDLLAGQAVEREHAHDLGHGDGDARGAHPVVVLLLELLAELAQLGPRGEGIRDIRAVLDGDHLGDFLGEEHEGATGVDDADRAVVAIQDQDL
ncbi:MAG: hypothetical protein ACK55I_43025, partial [bacterium]